MPRFRHQALVPLAFDKRVAWECALHYMEESRRRPIRVAMLHRSCLLDHVTFAAWLNIIPTFSQDPVASSGIPCTRSGLGPLSAVFQGHRGYRTPIQWVAFSLFGEFLSALDRSRSKLRLISLSFLRKTDMYELPCVLPRSVTERST